MLPSFKELYDLYADMVYNLCLNYLQNTADAEEVTQDVFVKVHAKMEAFKGESTPKTWIYRIAVNLCLDFLKAKNRKKRFGWNISLSASAAPDAVLPVNFENHPGIQLEEKEALEALLNHINALPSNQKTALLLKSTEGLSVAEIADVMGISAKATESLLSRARANLKKKLE